MNQENQVENLIEYRNKILKEAERLQNQASGLTAAISIIRDGKEKIKKEGIKSVLLGLLEDAGEHGLSPSAAISVAKENGISLHKPTVSSLLSRMKKERLLSFDGHTYKKINGNEAHP